VRAHCALSIVRGALLFPSDLLRPVSVLMISVIAAPTGNETANTSETQQHFKVEATQRPDHNISTPRIFL